MSLVIIAWLFTIGVAVHNAEEALFLPDGSKSAGRWHRPVGRAEFTFAVAVLTLLLVVLTAAAFVAGARSVWAYLFSGYVFTMVANTLMPHVLGSLILRRYMPGTATALLLNFPLGVLFLHEALSQQFVEWSTLVWVAPVFALSVAASIPALFAIGRRLARRRRGRRGET